MCNPPYVYSVMYDPTASYYITALGNGAVCVVKRKSLKITHYLGVHNQRIIDAVLSKDSTLFITASNDLSLGVSLYDVKSATLQHKTNIQINDAPNSILYNDWNKTIYVADTGNDISKITIKY